MIRKILSVAFVSLLTINANLLAATPSLLSHYRAVAEARLGHAQAECVLKLERKQAIMELEKRGHSTFSERSAAEVDYLTAEASRSAAAEFLEFLGKVENLASNGGAESPRRLWLISIPGLQDHVSLKAVGTLVISDSEGVSEQLLPLIKGRGLEQGVRRIAARDRHIEHLTLIRDDSVSSENEISIARMKRDLDHLRLQSDRPAIDVVELQSDCAPFEIDGLTVSNDRQLVALLNRVETQTQLAAEKKSTEAKLAFQRQLLQRVEVASRAGATLPFEVQTVKYQIEVLGKQLQQLVAHSESLREPSKLINVSVTSSGLGSGSLLAEVSAAEIQNAVDAAMAEITTIDEKIALIHEQCSFYRQRTTQLERLANNDSWFAGELLHARMMCDIATATSEKLAFDRQQAERTYRYTVELHKSQHGQSDGSTSEWTKSLIAVFKEAAGSSAEDKLLQSRLNLSKLRVAELTALRQQGLATWMELEAADVELCQIETRLQQIQGERELQSAIADLIGRANDVGQDESITALTR